MSTLRFPNRSIRRVVEREIARSTSTRHLWRPTVGRCEHCKDGKIGPVQIGTRWEPRIDSCGRPMRSGRIYTTQRVCTAHAYLIEVK
jgi:hypothetical protein